MPHHWPEETEFADRELDVLDRDCPHCGHLMYICDHRHRHFFTLDGPVHLIGKLNRPTGLCASGGPGDEMERAYTRGDVLLCWLRMMDACSRYCARPALADCAQPMRKVA